MSGPKKAEPKSDTDWAKVRDKAQGEAEKLLKKASKARKK
jgi:hypothetical protein